VITRATSFAAITATAALLLAAAPMPGLSAMSGGDTATAVTSVSMRLMPSAAGVLQGDLGAAPAGAPLAAATRVLAAHAGDLGIVADRFAFDHVRVSDLGVHVRGSEVRDGVKVAGTSAAVHVVDGRVVKVEARGSELVGIPAARSIDAGDAVATALAFANVTDTFVPPTVQRVLASDATGVLVDMHRVTLTSIAPAFAGTVLVDSASGAVLGVQDDTQKADAEALVFFPNPNVMSNNFEMRQIGHNPLETFVDTDVSPEADAELELRTVREYDVALAAAGNLSGPWVNVFAPAGYADGAFPITKSDPRFEGVNIYVNLDTAQRYFREVLGLEKINAEPQLTIAFPIVGFDNAFYQPGNDLLLFGAGGVDDGEDADVVLHEYGHAIHDDQVPGWGSRAEGGAMGEGFGDALSSAFYARTHGAVGIHCFADWDGSAIQVDGIEPCLRPNDDDSRMYPGGLQNQVHADGEMWSAFLTRLRPRLLPGAEFDMISRSDALAAMTDEQHTDASDRMLHLLLTSHELLSPTAEFQDAIDALLQAAVVTIDGEAELSRALDTIKATAAETTMPYSGAPYGG
jgi:hypothetical protein